MFIALDGVLSLPQDDECVSPVVLGLRQIWIELEEAIVDLEGFVEAIEHDQDTALVVQGGSIIRLQGQSGFDLRQCLLIAAEGAEDRGAGGVRCGLFTVEPNGLVQGAQCLLISAHPCKRHSTVVRCA